MKQVVMKTCSIKLNSITNCLISILFVLSAITKLEDFENTSSYYSSLFGLSLDSIRIMVALSISLEFMIAFLLPVQSQMQNILQKITLGLLALFFGFNVDFILVGVGNCGCYGTKILTSPWISAAKNLLLAVALFIVLLNKSKKEPYA